MQAASELGPALILQAAAGRPVRLAPGLMEEVQRGCDQARAALRRGGPVYGVTTGMGALSGIRLSQAQQRDHQRNLLLARAAGGPPWLSAADTRALIAVRLRTFLSGDAGVSAALCQRLAGILRTGPIPAVPRGGSGSAGEIIPLAHAFGPLVGIGRVLIPGGGTQTAGEALAARGLEPFPLGPKEGIALLAGVPGATALALRRLTEAHEVASRMTAAAALSVVAAGAPRGPYLAACARGDDVLGQVLARVREIAGDSQAPRALQAPVSFRVAGPVLAHLLRACGALADAVTRALEGVTDSPAFLGGTFVSTAGFHGLELAAQCDHLTAALTHACEVSSARTHRLLDPAVTGLPAQLAAAPGPETGLVTVHKRAAGEVHAMRRLAAPSTAGLIETSGGQEDVQSFAWEAAQVLEQALVHARAVTSCELLTACRAAALAGGPATGAGHGLMGLITAVTGPIESDRPFGEDIEALTAMDWPWPGSGQKVEPARWPRA